MEKNLTAEIGHQFQRAFASACEAQIQQLIRETRQEALASAKQILRQSALQHVLESVVDGVSGADERAPAPAPGMDNVVVSPVRVKAAKTEPAKRVKRTKEAPPVLNDRILEEIEAIREQIRRNELLLSQIKPFVQTSKVQEE
ncbi:MAG: hypothetical protein AAF564_16500 [Bacteroidota bacterium]